ncbi:hypothetical protein FOA43_000601 [Brettanomyces nanus]|uniref:LAA1-like C-terminal TPR repeats domain-containing protein n=1 Tax=Eeniella nana TaxID=13502 RepID=A0A875RZG8_EENNA|nr:uncharacterized protein FOA43_000601 [Brettanomyces nanus]QPG73292.1 hypothetical protein FOA43_000601 [Brettanomyces nanus]
MTSEFQFEKLKPKIICQNDSEACQLAQSELASYLSNILSFVESKADEPGTDDLLDLLEQLHLLLKYLLETYGKTTNVALLTVELDKLLAKDYAYIFSLMLESAHPKFSTKLIDLTSRMSDLVTSDVKKISLKTNWYSSLKHLAIIVLQFLFDKFNGFLNSYKEAVLNSLYKHLTKCHDNYNSAIEGNIFRANYFTDMVKLVDVLCANDSSTNLLNEKLFHRLLKLTKYVTMRDAESKFVYPLPAIIHSFNILTTLLKSDRYVSGLPSKKTAKNPTYYLTSLSKYLYQFVLSMDTDHKQLRLLLAKNLANILVFDYVVFGASTGQTDTVLKSSVSFLLSNYMKETSTKSIRMGILECLVQYISKLNLYYQTNSLSSGSAGDHSNSGINFAAYNFFDIMQVMYHYIFGVGQPLKLSNKGPDRDSLLYTVTNTTQMSVALKILDELSMFYSFMLRELDSDVNKLIILATIVLGDEKNASLTSLNSLLKSPIDECPNEWYALSLLEFSQAIISDIGEYVLTRQDGISDSHEDVGTQVAGKLFEFCKNENYKLRVKSAETLVKLVQIKPELSFNILNTSMDNLELSFDEKSGNKGSCFNENHGYAFLISLLLTSCPNDHISTDLVLKVLTLCTNSLKRFNSSVVSNNLLGGGAGSGVFISNASYEKQLISWILMMGLFNFASTSSGGSEGNLFWLENSQYLGIWKNLLGHSLPSEFVQYDLDIHGHKVITNVGEIVKLVEIKNHALACLITYIGFLSGSNSSKTQVFDDIYSGSHLTPEIAKQLNQLLAKSFIFLKNLKAQAENNCDLPPFLATRMKLNKLRIYEALITLMPFLNIRNDLNSSILLQTVNDFSDINAYRYNYIPVDFAKTAKAKETYKLDEYEIYRVDDGLNFGMTSKLNGFGVDELMIKRTGINHYDAIDNGKGNKDDDHDIDIITAPEYRMVESPRIKSHLSPVSVFDTSFESFSRGTFAHNFIHDPLLSLMHDGSNGPGYTETMQYPVGNGTMIVDLAVEIFAMAFPYLTSKIQQSVIENMRTAVFYKSKESRDLTETGKETPATMASKQVNMSLLMRKKAVTVNVSMAIHSSLSFMTNMNLQNSTLMPALSSVVVELLAKTLKNFDSNDAYMANLNSESIGMCCALIDIKTDTDVITNQISMTVNSIIQNSQPLLRSFDINTLASIARFTKVSNRFNINGTLLILALDPHPMVHASALDAIATLISTQSPTELDTEFLWKVLLTLEKIWIGDSFGIHATTSISCNMSYREHLSSTVLISRVLRAIVNLAGPLICSWPESYKKIIHSLLLGLIYLTTDNFVVVSRELLKTLEELTVFDKTLISPSVYRRFIKFLLLNNFRVGVYGHALSSLPLNSDDDNSSISELFPVTTSDIIWKMAWESYHQLIRISQKGTGIITDRMELLLWISLDHDASNKSVKRILKQLLEDCISGTGSTKLQWLDKLIDYFNIAKSDLVHTLLDVFRKRINNGGMFFRASLSTAVSATRGSTSRRKTQPGIDSSSAMGTDTSRRSISPRNYDDEDANADAEAGGALNGLDEGLSSQSSEAPTISGPAAKAEDINSQDRNFHNLSDSLQLLDLESEQTCWRFKLVIVDLLNDLLSYAYSDEKLRLHLSKRVPDFIRISFICSTSSLTTLRVSSLKMLESIIDIYADMKDPLYRDVSILDQQQAQIVTAIIPAFDKGSTVELTSEAILLASKLVTSGVTPINSVGRILKILTSSLEEFATQSSLGNGRGDEAQELSGRGKPKVGEMTITSLKAQNKIKVHILQGWARIMANANRNDEQLQKLVAKYSEVLIPLWFYSLRNYAMLKYGEEYSLANTEEMDLETFQSSWIDILNALGKVAGEEPDKFTEYLGDEATNFFFIVFGQCMEFLIKLSSRKQVIDDKQEAIVLESLQKLLRLDMALKILFKDLIFPEFIDLLDRLVSISSTDIQLCIVDLCKNVFEGYFNMPSDASAKLPDELSNDVDRLFELIRVNTLVIARILPFVRDRYIDMDKMHPVSQSDLVLLKKSFDAIVEMIGYLPDVMRVDLYSCILYIFTLIYQLGNGDIISMLLPTLKRTITNFEMIDSSDPNLLNFYATIKGYLKRDTSYALLTVLIIASTLKNLKLTSDESDEVAQFIASGLTLEDTNLVILSTQTVKTLIKTQQSQNGILAKLIPKLIHLVSSDPTNLQEPKLVLEILITLAKSLSTDDEILASYELVVPTLVWFSELNKRVFLRYAHFKLLDFIKFSPIVFKSFIESSCSVELKAKIEQLVKLSLSSASLNNSQHEELDEGFEADEENGQEGEVTHINLKKFE